MEGNADLKEFKVKLLCNAFIVKDVMGNNQISFGMGFDEVRAFFEEYGKGLWWTYDTSYIPSEGTANERDKEIYNYILCAVSHLADLFLADSKVNIADPVSYTHLDVYKRQHLHDILQLAVGVCLDVVYPAAR